MTMLYLATYTNTVTNKKETEEIFARCQEEAEDKANTYTSSIKLLDTVEYIGID